MIHRHLLDAYARLLTVDTKACAALFAPDAEYTTRLGSQLVHLVGRPEIEAFLGHVPRQVCFRAAVCRAHGDGFRGTVEVRFPDLGVARHAVAFDLDGRQFRTFDVRPGRIAPERVDASPALS